MLFFFHMKFTGIRATLILFIFGMNIGQVHRKQCKSWGGGLKIIFLFKNFLTRKNELLLNTAKILFRKIFYVCVT